MKQFYEYIAVVFFLLVFLAQYYYQRKALRYADELLEKYPTEYSKQIKANAYRYLISRIIWGVLFLSRVVLNYQQILVDGFNWITGTAAVFGIVFIIWGILGFRSEMKYIKPELD